MIDRLGEALLVDMKVPWKDRCRQIFRFVTGMQPVCAAPTRLSTPDVFQMCVSVIPLMWNRYTSIFINTAICTGCLVASASVAL